MLWHKILAQGGIQLPLKDDVAVVLEVFKMKLKETRNPVVLELEVLRAIAPVFERFEAVEKANGTLSRRSICPEKTVPVQFALPAGKYIVEWVNDRTGAVVRSGDCKKLCVVSHTSVKGEEYGRREWDQGGAARRAAQRARSENAV
ncbi:MAG TPA: hypothetical protein VGD41_00305 [Pyrinomonadaceae bacterium]